MTRLEASPAPPAAPAPDLGRALDAALAGLDAAGERLRAWSLVVTVFGDAAAHRGGALRLASLQTITGRLGVAPGALRTAMSRLARDGWLARERRGRASYYRLTDDKRAELAAATARIYAAGPPEWDGGWTLALAAPGAPRGARAEALRALGYGRAAPGLWLRPGARRDAGEDELVAAALGPGASVLRAPADGAEIAPALIAAAWPPAPAAARFTAMTERAAPLFAALEAGVPTPPLEAVAARALLLHLWRRAALAAPDLPASLRPPDWPGERARALMRAAYWRLAPASETWLDGCEGARGGRLPPADPAFSRRFGGPPPPPA